ncbi:MAG: 50S ribosomal protein L35 [Spirochaetales bacterium]|nr:50S ribosomal protein L35 [Spirochaetales bacterium]
MPKLKTNKSAAKRFRVTGSGRVKRARAFKNHILTKKSKQRKRRLRQGAIIEKVDMPNIRLLLPYGN